MNLAMIQCGMSVRETDHLETPDFRLNKYDHVSKNPFIFRFWKPTRVGFGCLGKAIVCLGLWP